jgi:thyrotropin-releasing hormone receptor
MNNTTEVFDEAFESIVLPEYIALTSLVLCSIILAVGLLGNLLVIVVILTSKVLRSSTNLFLLNLSVADLLVLATCTPTALVEIATRRDAWVMGKVSVLLCYLPHVGETLK